MKKIRFGLIGTGVVGERIINQILKNSEAEITAVYDENKSRLKEISTKYGLEMAGTVEELLDAKLDWVYIGTPPVSHAPLAEMIAERGIRILSEKPLAHDYSSGERMVRVSKEAGVQTAMHFPLMYSPVVHELKRAVEQKELGNIVRIELHTYFPHWPRKWQQNPWIGSREQGGFIREVFPHYLQLAYHLFGELDIVSHSIEYPMDDSLCETGVMAIGKTDGCIPLLLNGLSGVGQEEKLEFRVLGTEKVMVLRNWSELWVSEKGVGEKKLEVSGDVTSLIQACCDAVRGRKALTVSFEEGLLVQGWIDGLLK